MGKKISGVIIVAVLSLIDGTHGNRARASSICNLMILETSFKIIVDLVVGSRELHAIWFKHLIKLFSVSLQYSTNLLDLGVTA